MTEPEKRNEAHRPACGDVEKLIEGLPKLKSDDPDLLAEKIEEAGGIARAITDPLEKADALGLTARAWEEAGDWGRALEIYLEALETVEKSGSPETAEEVLRISAGLQLKIGYIYLFKSARYDGALARFLESFRISEKLDQVEDCVKALSAAGYVQREMKNYKEALDYFHRAVEKGEEGEDRSCIVSALNEIGNIHMMKGDHGRSEKYRRRALDLARQTGSSYMIGFITHDLGCMYLEQGKHEEALKCFEDSLEAGQDGREKSIIYHNIASVHRELGYPDLADEYVSRSMAIAGDAGYDPGTEQSLTLISNLAYDRGDYLKACDSLRRAVELKEKIFDQERMRQIAELQAQYEVEKKEAAAEIYRLRNIELAKANTRIEKQKEELEKALEKLKKAMDEVKILGGLIPICAECKRIRDDKGFWQRVEVYIRDRSDAEFTHGICPECVEKLYPKFNEKMKKKKSGG